MILAALGFTIMVACVKEARGEGMSTPAVMLWRALITAPLAASAAFASGGGLRIHNVRVFLLRVALGFGAMFCVFTAAKGIAVADLSLIWRLQPVIVAVLAPIALGSGERMGKALFAVLGVGLVGCGVLLGPQVEIGGTTLQAGLWTLVGCVLGAGAHVCLRALGKTERAPVVVFWFQALVAVLSWLTLIASGDALLPPPVAWPVLIGAGVAAAGAQLLMTQAYRLERAAVVSAAGYMAPLWAVIIDFVAFDRAPPWSALAGGALILGSSAWLLRLSAPGTPLKPGQLPPSTATR